MAINISVIILTKNSEKYLSKCLDALISFDEIIVLDNGSTDNTLSIIQDYANTKLITHDFIGFGPLRNIAISHAKNDWIFCVDSDEIVSCELVKEITTYNLKKQTIYSIQRDNYYNNQLISCCGWGQDYVLRLFNKHITQFNNNLVHESIEINNQDICKLHHRIKHYSFDNINDLITKMQYYSTLWAQHNSHQKTNIMLIILKTKFAFIKYYFFKGGIFAGYKGLVISVSNALGVFYKYMKVYEQNKTD